MGGSATAKALLVLGVCSISLVGWYQYYSAVRFSSAREISKSYSLNALEIGRARQSEKPLLSDALPVSSPPAVQGNASAAAGLEGGVHVQMLDAVAKLREITAAKQVEIDKLRKLRKSGGGGKSQLDAKASSLPDAPTPPKMGSPSAPSPGSAETRSSCAHQALLHGATLAESERKYDNVGLYKWGLVDAFITNGADVGATRDKEGDFEGRKVATFVITAHVYAGPPFNLPVGKAKPRRRGDYDKLVQSEGLSWACTFAGSTGATSPVIIPKLDGDKHTLVVHCNLPKVMQVSPSTRADGRLIEPAGLEAKLENGNIALRFRNVHLCTKNLIPSPIERGACTMFGEMSPLHAPAAAASWTRFMLAAGFQFVALYLDPVGDAALLEVQLQKVLAAEFAAGSVSTVRFHRSGRVAFETQTAQQMHCHWRFRGRSKWLAQLDIDEYLQPLGSFRTIGDVLAKYEKKNSAALQVRNRYWDHHPVNEKESFALERHDVWNMVWRDARPSKHGREKLIYRPELVDYIAVHRVTLGGKMAKPNAGTEIRHNHFSRHFKGWDEGVGCGGRENQGAHCRDAMEEVVKDLSFQEFYHRIMNEWALTAQSRV